MNHDNKSCHHDRDHAHQFDEDVQGWSGRVFEWISYCVTHNRSVVIDRVLTSEVTVLDIFLGIIPGTT